MAFCTQCGSQLPDGAVFCSSCGAQVAQTQKQVAGAAPTFTPPEAPMTTPSAAPTFTPSAAPTSTPSAAPTFTPPAAQKFTPPAAPTFTPPAQTFTPPTRTHNGAVCYYHQDEPAVAKCVRCGKYICKDCAEAYTVTSGEYANQCLCYDCCQALVSENVATLKKQKGKIIALFAATIIGMIIGAIVGSSGGGAIGLTIFWMLWFGSFWTWIKSSVSGWWNNPAGRSIAGFIGACIGGLIIAPIKTIIKVVQCIVYLVKTSKFIAEDSEALTRMREYMEYTQVVSRNRGVDIETLLRENSQLADNSVAQMARTQTEEQIEASMRSCLATINENGEIIRSFAA